MSTKQKLLRAIASVTMAATMVGSVFAFTACKTDNDPPKHVHHYVYTQVAGTETHTGHCDSTTGTCDKPDLAAAACTDTDNNGKCDVCNGNVTTTPPAPAAEFDITFDVNTNGGKWDDDTTENKTVKTSSKKVTAPEGTPKKDADNVNTYTFKGWGTTSQATDTVDLSTETFSAASTLYAIFDAHAKTPEPGPSTDTETSQTYLDFVEQAGSNLVYKNSFETAAAVPYGAAAATSADGAKVYGTLNNSASYVSGGSVSIADGELKITDTESGNTVFGHIALDEALAVKKVNIHVEYKVTVESNGWTQFFIYNSNAQEVLGLRTTAKTALGYRVSGGTATGSATYSANGLIVADISVNLLKGEFTVKINGTDITDASNKTLGANAGDIAELRFGTATADRSITVANVAISAEEGTLEEVTAYYDTKVAAYNTTYTHAEMFEAIKTAATAANTAYTSASKTSNAEVETAYNAYVAAIVAALKTNGVAFVQSHYPATDYDDAKNTDKTAYESAIATLTTELADSEGVLNTIEDCLQVFEKADNAIKDLHKDEYFNKKDVKIIVHVNEQTVEITGKKVDEKITLAEIEEQIAAKLTGFKVLGYYKEEGYSNTVDFGTDGYVLAEGEGTPGSSNDIEVNIYVKTRELQECEGSWHYYVEGNDPKVSGNEPTSNTFAFSDPTSGTKSTNAADFKFSDKATVITITLKVKSGQKITFDVTAFTGSGGSAVGLECKTHEGATAVSDNLVLSFDSSTTVEAPGKGQLVFTADADGTVTFTFVRNPGKTTRVISIDVTVESVTD